jgi:hypothetical protein
MGPTPDPTPQIYSFLCRWMRSKPAPLICPNFFGLNILIFSVWFHRQVAYSMAFWAMVHTTAHYVNFFVCIFSFSFVASTHVRGGGAEC